MTKVVHVLNLVDCVLTLILLNMFPGLEEGNPTMAWALAQGVPMFVVVKIVLGNGGIYLLDKYKQRIAMFLIGGLLLCVVLMQIAAMFVL